MNKIGMREWLKLPAVNTKYMALLSLSSKLLNKVLDEEWDEFSY